MDLGTALGFAGLVVGVPALVIAISPFVQLIWGRPSLELSPDEFTGSEGKILIIKIKNQQTKKFLHRIGVERETGYVQASFDIQEQGTNKFVVKGVPALIQCPPIRQSGLLMQALPAFTVGVVVLGFGGPRGKESPGIVDPRRGPQEPLIPIADGHYTVSVHVFCGEQVYGIKKNMKVGQQAHETIWY